MLIAATRLVADSRASEHMKDELALQTMGAVFPLFTSESSFCELNNRYETHLNQAFISVQSITSEFKIFD